MTQKAVPKVAFDPENCSESHECTRENGPMRERESWNRNLMRLSEQSEKLVFSKKPTEALYLLISLTRQAKNIKTLCACTKSTDLLIYRPQKIFIW
jgi:hypothetical protein